MLETEVREMAVRQSRFKNTQEIEEVQRATVRKMEKEPPQAGGKGSVGEGGKEGVTGSTYGAKIN